MSSDTELLRKKRELELKKKMLQLQTKNSIQAKTALSPSEPNPSEIVKTILVGRASEVLETARRHYPREMSDLETRLADLITAGRLKGPISGEELYSFLRRAGLLFSLDTKIRVSEHGRVKSLEDKLRHRDE